MEFLDISNLDDPSVFPNSVCRPGSVGQWGGNTTCVPDVTTLAGQAYYIAWGKAFIDAGSESAVGTHAPPPHRAYRSRCSTRHILRPGEAHRRQCP